jgi:competence protein ComEC
LRVALVLGAAVMSLISAQARASSPGIRWIDVGQGSSALIVGTEGEVVMIDSGPSSGAEAILRAFAEHEISQIDLWIHTHYDSDHIGGISRVLKGADALAGTADDVVVQAFWDRGLQALPQSEAVAHYFAAVGEHRRAVEAGARWASGGLELEIVWGDRRAAASSENARGLALCVRINGINLLAPGDLPVAAVAEAARGCRPVEVLWASHHGAKDGMSAAALEEIDPALVVISAGMGNIHCHPAAQVLGLLVGVDVWMTGAAGLDPRASCSSIASALAARHWIEAGDLFLALRP